MRKELGSITNFINPVTKLGIFISNNYLMYLLVWLAFYSCIFMVFIFGVPF